jgi:hypothetical protein
MNRNRRTIRNAIVAGVAAVTMTAALQVHAGPVEPRQLPADDLKDEKSVISGSHLPGEGILRRIMSGVLTQIRWTLPEGDLPWQPARQVDPEG